MAAAQTLADVAASYLLNARAREDLRESSELARQSSLHDALTGLPNRTLLVERLDHAILRCRRSGKMVVVLYADLDRFKSINDSYGHHVGDLLLVAVADRLTGLVRPGDTVAGLAGDEFVVMCEDLDDAAQVEPLTDRIGAALSAPFVLLGVEVRLSASVGIAFAGQGGELSEQVLQDADTAMYEAKRGGGARHGIIDLREESLSSVRAGLSRDLGGAWARDELWTEYQPIVDIHSGYIVGVEALLRWTHPNHGVVPAELAVALAEQSGLIADIGRWVLEQACLDRHRWQMHARRRAIEISVNVSAQQVLEGDFASTVASVRADTHTDPRLVTLDVTETVFLNDAARALVVLDDLKSIGVMLALDDFGTGFSSLSYLKQFPVDTVKVDRGFVEDAEHDPSSRIIMNAIVELAHGLRMTVVAEGVESIEQCDAIAAFGCEYYQGFHYARPMSADGIETLLTFEDRNGPRLALAGPS